jgi:hypothetical protein
MARERERELPKITTEKKVTAVTVNTDPPAAKICFGTETREREKGEKGEEDEGRRGRGERGENRREGLNTDGPRTQLPEEEPSFSGALAAAFS